MLLCALRSWRELAKRRRTQRKLERTKASGLGSECPWWYQGSEVPFFLVQLAIICCGGAPSRGATAFLLPHHGSAVAPCCCSTIGRGNAQAAWRHMAYPLSRDESRWLWDYEIPQTVHRLALSLWASVRLWLHAAHTAEVQDNVEISLHSIWLNGLNGLIFLFLVLQHGFFPVLFWNPFGPASKLQHAIHPTPVEQSLQQQRVFFFAGLQWDQRWNWSWKRQRPSACGTCIHQNSGMVAWSCCFQVAVLRSKTKHWCADAGAWGSSLVWNATKEAGAWSVSFFNTTWTCFQEFPFALSL